MPDKEPKDNQSEIQTPFANLDLREWYCFGIEHPKANSWVNLCIMSRTLGWNKVNTNKLEQSLKTNVDASYMYIASFYLTDLDDETKYLCYFDNQKGLWGLEIQDSPKAEIELETKAAFFKSDMFKKIANRSADLIGRAVHEYDEVIEQRLKTGELLQVDEVKLAAILHIANQKMTIENLRNGKWMK